MFNQALRTCSLCSVWLGVMPVSFTLKARVFAGFNCAPGCSDEADVTVNVVSVCVQRWLRIPGKSEQKQGA